jgi:hypothetical protein
MIELGTASEDDVVLAFLRAEIDSPKWEPNYSHALRELKLDRVSLVDAADLEDARVCSARKDLLGVVRGYGRNVALFEGFPKDTTWRRVKVEQPDFQRLKCISKDERWSKLTGGTRLIREAARNFEDYPVRVAIRRIEQRLPIAELIIVETGSGDLVLVEGHTRATAYAVLSDRAFQSFVGISPLMGQWAFI